MRPKCIDSEYAAATLDTASNLCPMQTSIGKPEIVRDPPGALPGDDPSEGRGRLLLVARSCLYLGDEVSVNTYWPLPSNGFEWRGEIKAFVTSPREAVLVEAVERRDDPQILDEMWCSFGALTRVGGTG